MINEPASGEQLRRLWQNLKTRQRDALTRERQHRMATGGGGPCPDADIDPNIAEISPALFVEIQNTLDSDHIEVETVQETSNMETDVTATVPDPTSNPIISHSEIQSDEPSSEFSSNEKKLRVQILKAEHISREKRAEELHKLQVKFLQEKHDVEMQIMKEKLKEAKAKAESAQHHQ
ncbi:uncharacterized protein LOC113499898 [Trichoplusia ni]|uniref:Uncharacterized protein LOC113499898 n=1 Tax=Trichoplusia ni TaxID=7111 RepID=A0A7E5W703_TRINI|nr:uncharacterized protein LOC113499898 [Trichoplusia ni]